MKQLFYGKKIEYQNSVQGKCLQLQYIKAGKHEDHKMHADNVGIGHHHVGATRRQESLPVIIRSGNGAEDDKRPVLPYRREKDVSHT